MRAATCRWIVVLFMISLHLIGLYNTGSCAAICFTFPYASRMALGSGADLEAAGRAAPQDQDDAQSCCRGDPEQTQHGDLTGLQRPEPAGQWHQERQPSGGPGRD